MTTVVTAMENTKKWVEKNEEGKSPRTNGSTKRKNNRRSLEKN